jgi:hypothetical protein
MSFLLIGVRSRLPAQTARIEGRIDDRHSSGWAAIAAAKGIVLTYQSNRAPIRFKAAPPGRFGAESRAHP